MAITIFQQSLDALVHTLKWMEHAFITLFMVAILLTVMVCVSWLLDHEPPIKYTNLLVTNVHVQETNKFRPGDTMVVTRWFCTDADRQVVEYEKRFVTLDGQESYVIPGGPLVLPTGCTNSTLGVQIPSWIKPQTYTYKVSGRWRNNPLVSGVVEAPAPTIEILE